MADTGKEVIKTSTLKKRILMHGDIDTDDANTAYLAYIGLGQVVQSVLGQDGWRSVLGNGYFAAPSVCEHGVWLKEMLRNAETRVKSAESAYENVRQIAFAFDGAELSGMVEEPNIEDIVADLEAHAI